MTENSSKQARSLGQTLSLGWLASANVVVSLVIQWYVITSLGIGVETDALFAGLIVPQLILSLVTTALLHVLVPLLATRAGAKGDDLQRELWGILLQMCGLAAAIAAALHLTADYWARWLVPAFSAEARALTVTLARIQLCGLLFATADCVLRAACRARRSFLWAEASTPVANLMGLLLLVWALPRYGVEAAAWIMVLRIALPVALMWPVLGRWRRPRWWSPMRAEALHRARPLLTGGLYTHITLLVTRLLASLAPTGGLSLFTAGQQLYLTANVVMEKAFVIQAAPSLAVQARDGQWNSFRSLYRQRLALMGLLAGAGYLVVLVFGQSLLALVVGHGGVTAANITALWWMLAALGGAFVSSAMGQAVFAAFCAKGDTRTPVMLAVIINTVNIPARALGFWGYGLWGMAVAMSAFSFVGLLVNLFFLEKSIPTRGRQPALAQGVEVKEQNETSPAVTSTIHVT
jgi:putative peptidoglycan lipid II flippase